MYEMYYVLVYLSKTVILHLNFSRPRYVEPVWWRQPRQVFFHPSGQRTVQVVQVEERAQGHRVQVDGLQQVGEEGALNAKDVPAGKLIWKKEKKV